MKAFFRERGPALLTAAAVAALVAWAAWVRARFLLAWPYPYGIDGYWYAVQARTILEEGRMAYPSAPLTPYVVAVVARFSDPIVATKIVAAWGTALAVVPAYLLGRRAAGGHRAAGLFGATLAATAAGSFYLSTEFVKEGVGITLAAAFAAALAWGLDRPGRARAALPAVLLILCAAAHKTSAGLAVVLGLPLVLAAALRARKRRFLVAGALFLVVLVILGALAPERFLGPRDLGLLRGLFRADPEWSLAALDRAGGRLHFQYEVPIAAALALLALAASRWKLLLGERVPLEPLALGFVVVALAVAIPWLDARDPDGLAYRLRLLAFLPLAVLAARPARRLGRVAPLVLAAALLWLRPTTRDGIIQTHPGLALTVRSLAGVVPEGATVVTPERQIAFMTVWYARVRARTRPPAESSPAHTFRLIPQASMRPELAQLLDQGPAVDPPPREIHYLRHALVLVREDAFQRLLERLPPEARELYLRWPTR